MEIIGLLGHQGVGKNYIAEEILLKKLDYKPTLVIAFADHFKVEGISKYDLEYDKVYGEKDFYTRKRLHLIGTEEGRQKFGYDIWIKTIHNWIKIYNSRGIKRFIIPDVRFQNEVDWIKSLNGIVIKINAPNRYIARVKEEANNDSEKIQKIISHESESMIDKIENYDFLFNNDYNDNINNEIETFIKLNKIY